MEEKQLTSRELEEQANALLAEADFEEINLPKKAKKAAAAKKANEDTAQAEKPAEKYPPLDEKLVASLPAAALLQGSEKLMEIFAKGKAKGKLSSSDLMETIDEMNLESEQLDQIYDSLETLGIDIGTAEAIDSSIDDVEPPMEEIAEIEEEELVDPTSWSTASRLTTPCACTSRRSVRCRCCRRTRKFRSRPRCPRAWRPSRSSKRLKRTARS